MSSTRRIPRLRDALGALAVVGTLALLSPGVALSPDVAHADSAAVSSEGSYPADGPSCQAGPGPEALAADLQHYIAMIRAEAVRQGAAGDTDVVVLDNRGHNYRTTRVPDPALLQAEERVR